MKKFILLIVGVIIFNHSALSQQQNLLKKDSTSPRTYQFNNPKLLDSTIPGKNNNIGKGLSFSDSIQKFRSSNDTTKSKIHKMPIFIPKGNHKIRLNEIDTTKHYSLRIIKPNKDRVN